MKQEDGTDLANAGLGWEAVIALMNENVFAIRDEEIVRQPFRRDGGGAGPGGEADTP